MSLHEKHCCCGYAAHNPRGLANHWRHCQPYKDALNCRPTRLIPRGPIDRSHFMRAPTQVISHGTVQEEPGLSLHLEGEEPLVHLTNATDDIQMVLYLMFLLLLFNLISSFRMMFPSQKLSRLSTTTLVSSSAQRVHVACLRAIRTSFLLCRWIFFSKKSLWMTCRSHSMHQKYQERWKWTVLLQNFPPTYHFVIQKKMPTVYIIPSHINSRPLYHVEHSNSSVTHQTLTWQHRSMIGGLCHITTFEWAGSRQWGTQRQFLVETI